MAKKPRLAGTKTYQTKGLIGIIANDSARYSEFAACVTQLQTPRGWDIEWVIGGDWCSARNALAQRTLDEGYTHLWFMDDDHSFAPDILLKLLRHNQPLVNPMCLTRVYPFQPVTYVEEGALDLDSVPGVGLVQLHAGGTAGMLIQRMVLEATSIEVTGRPWFEYSDKSEDVIFCEKAKAAGFQLYADLEARLGHITTAVVWPSYSDDLGWMTGFTIGKDLQMRIPLTSDLLENNITRIDVPMDETTLDVDDELEERVDEMFDELDDVQDEIGILDDQEPVTNPCHICGKQATWTDVYNQMGCGDHLPDHPAWRESYERIEMWFVEAEQRWYFRVLRGDQTIAIVNDRGFTQEVSLLETVEREFSGVPVFHILDELSSSHTGRIGPPVRLWNRTAT